MSNIIDLHIKRTIAAYRIPYDKLYFVYKEHREHIPSIFKYALVLPVSEDLKNALRTVTVDEVNFSKHHRDDAAKKLDASALFPAPHKTTAWWDAFFEKYEIDKRVVVIPVLTATVRKVIRPRYLTSRKWFDHENKRRRLARTRTVHAAIHELAYLATPHPAPQDKIRPLCSICPRMLLQLQGECTPGQTICYQSLDFNEINAPTPPLPVVDEAETEEDAGILEDND